MQWQLKPEAQVLMLRGYGSLSPNLHAGVSETIISRLPRADWGRGQSEGPNLGNRPLILTFSPKFNSIKFFQFSISSVR